MEKAILALGLFLFGTVYIIPINVVAIFFSVALGFFANESWTVWHGGDHSAMWKGILARPSNLRSFMKPEVRLG